MWHVEEGTLHAWLDDRERGEAAGALAPAERARVAEHLAACDVCAAQLRAAERDRSRAGDILLAAAPAIDTPPFEALAPAASSREPAPGLAAAGARVPAPRVRPASTRRAWVPMAWAASLVLAIGAGWMGRQLWQGSEPARTADQAPAGTADAAARTEPAPPPMAAAPSLPAAGVAVQSAAGEGQSAAEAKSAENPAAGRGGQTAERADVRNQVAAADAVLPERRDVARTDVAAAQRVAAAPTQTSAAEQEAAPPTATAAAQQKAAAPTRSGVAAPAPLGGVARNQAGDAAAVGRVRAADAAAAAPLEMLAARPAQDFVAGGIGAGYPGDADVAWHTVTREAAERLLNAPLYLLADAPVLELAAASAAAPALVRVRQRTDAGTVELLQWRTSEAQSGAAQDALRQESRAAAPPTAPPAAAAPRRLMLSATGKAKDGDAFVTVPGTVSTVLLKAPPNADIATLLARVRPAK